LKVLDVFSFSRPEKSLKRGQVLESPFIYEVLKVLGKLTLLAKSDAMRKAAKEDVDLKAIW